MTANEQLVAFFNAFPRGGGYSWNPKKPTSGVTQDLIYQGEMILRKDTATYCCGLTFEGWFRTIGVTLDIPVKDMRKVQQLSYCAVAGNRKGCQDALAFIAMGTPVTLEEALPGDLLQLWRQNGSGHSVNYVKHDKVAGTVTYFSTQPLTRGPGERTEKLAKLTDLYFVRAMLPVVV